MNNHPVHLTIFLQSLGRGNLVPVFRQVKQDIERLGPCPGQRAKKVVSDSLGLVDFAIGPVNSVFNLPDGQVMFFEEFE